MVWLWLWTYLLAIKYATKAQYATQLKIEATSIEINQKEPVRRSPQRPETESRESKQNALDPLPYRSEQNTWVAIA